MMEAMVYHFVTHLVFNGFHFSHLYSLVTKCKNVCCFTKVGPQAIYVVGRDDDDESIAAGSEVSNGAASWETVDNDEMDSVENAAEVLFFWNTKVGVSRT